MYYDAANYISKLDDIQKKNRILVKKKILLILWWIMF